MFWIAIKSCYFRELVSIWSRISADPKDWPCVALVMLGANDKPSQELALNPLQLPVFKGRFALMWTNISA